jgi:hypothetical protein
MIVGIASKAKSTCEGADGMHVEVERVQADAKWPRKGGSKWEKRH